MVNTQTEFNAINIILNRKNPELLIRLTPAHFGNEEIRKIFILIQRFYTDNAAFPGWDVLRSKVAAVCTTADKSIFMMSLLDKLQDRDTAGLTDEALMDEMDGLHKVRNVLKSVEKITYEAEAKNVEAVLSLVREAYNSIAVTEQNKLEDCDMASLAGKEVRFDFQQVGLPPLDERGCLIQGGYTIIAGESKAGKSLLGQQFSTYGYDVHGNDVAVFSYEQSKEEWRARILSSRSDVDIGKITTGDLLSEDRVKLRIAEAQFILRSTEGLSLFCEKNNGLVDSEFYQKLFDNFSKRENKFRIYSDCPDWDQLFVRMELLANEQGTSMFVIDYPFLIPRGQSDSHMQTWEYNLDRNQKLKLFAARHKVRVIAMAQYDSKQESLKYIKGAVNACDLALALSQSKEDKIMNQVTVDFLNGVFRNYRTVVDKPLGPFKLQREFNKARFAWIEF